MQSLADSRVIAIFRRERYGDPLPLVDALASGGLSAVEFTFTGSDAAGAIVRTKRAFPRMTVGAGTVLTERELHAALEAGADFIASPSLDIELVRAGARRTLMLPGVLTPTEITAGIRAGAPALKLFPAGRFGPNYVREMAVLFPGVPLIPSGGIGLSDAKAYLAAGAAAVGIGSSLTGGPEDDVDLKRLTERAATLATSCGSTPLDLG
jgi:2-dehydro-3-deoxyphosphogluconate aldolase/(4S)-4-hydroxy-2-oxoglutarate aldolase